MLALTTRYEAKKARKHVNITAALNTSRAINSEHGCSDKHNHSHTFTVGIELNIMIDIYLEQRQLCLSAKIVLINTIEQFFG